uniref:Uncharacterized protein n=1 Tax=Cucumis melo TaxID=3656 RepID=A0A9I9EDT5_CUCME
LVRLPSPVRVRLKEIREKRFSAATFPYALSLPFAPPDLSRPSATRSCSAFSDAYTPPATAALSISSVFLSCSRTQNLPVAATQTTSDIAQDSSQSVGQQVLCDVSLGAVFPSSF